ncbi:dTDP-4-dehydrorhamnose reductase [Noviherbaspirillum sp. 1P10PC]|uniref:dTDP-4-dehydrorhamnose reductase n=1 Tax=Noviherbaspirillum sp. 1P10PC TaxID=3132292 RepID=UPI0039A15EF6
MKILLTGVNGQVGYELQRSLQPLGEVMALNRAQLDIGNFNQIRNVIRELKPDLVVNPAAYTAVDKAEVEPELAMRINGVAPGVMAEECARIGAALIHYSTDYVFDGTKDGAYAEDDAVCPINVYGRTKAEGERAIQAAGCEFFIFRTSWVYGMYGNNFLKTVLRLARERDELKIVSDQYGAPTWSRTIADTTSNVLAQLYGSKRSTMDRKGLSGIYHLSSQGSATWYDFAKAILANADAKKNRVLPIRTEEYPLPASRPKNSSLSCERLISTFCHLPEWETALALCQK